MLNYTKNTIINTHYLLMIYTLISYSSLINIISYNINNNPKKNLFQSLYNKKHKKILLIPKINFQKTKTKFKYKSLLSLSSILLHHHISNNPITITTTYKIFPIKKLNLLSYNIFYSSNP